MSPEFQLDSRQTISAEVSQRFSDIRRHTHDGSLRQGAPVVQLRLHVTREALFTGFTVSTERGDDMESLFGSEGRGSMRASTSGGQVPLLQGRPRTDDYMTQLGREAGRADRAGRGIAVVCCGPRPMVKEVGRQVLMRAPAPTRIRRMGARKGRAVWVEKGQNLPMARETRRRVLPGCLPNNESLGLG
jgi:hypothetical protein